MKLKCVSHERRVVVTEHKTVVHRGRLATDVTDTCSSDVLIIGGFRVGGRNTLERQIKGRRNRRVGARLRKERDSR